MDDPTTQLTHIQLVNFRCFKRYTLDIHAPYVLFEGANGAGKTSILEALYYACYLRSFRTHTPKDLIAFGFNEFFVKIDLALPQEHLSHAIQIGFSAAKKLVKIDQKTISSYKDLMAHYRIISITESDLALVQEGPYYRRIFLDQMLLLLDASYNNTLKTYRQIVDQRNALLQSKSSDSRTHEILTKQLWHQTHTIQEQRTELLKRISKIANYYNHSFIDHLYPMEFLYCSKYDLERNYEAFVEKHAHLKALEYRLGRTLFGAHLDDIIIKSHSKLCRFFTSRGQQKQIVILLKLAQLEILLEHRIPAICLLDDFMTDFDSERGAALIMALQKVGTQLIFTSPMEGGEMGSHLRKIGAQMVKLTS